MRCSRVVLMFMVLIADRQFEISLADESLGRGQLLSVIAAGTIVGDAQAERWNRTVLLARPRIASGAIESLPQSVKRAVPKFSLSILATVTSHPVGVEDATANSPANSNHRLHEVGVGYSAEVNGRTVIVTNSTARKLGLELDFFESRMLAENEKQISQLQTLVHTSSLVIFDAPAVVLRDQKHHDVLMRHLIWVDAHSGRLGILVWLLASQQAGLRVLDSRPIRLVAESTREDRAIHVASDEFFLGIPTKRAFALQDLPPGRELKWTDSLRVTASRANYDLPTLSELITAVNASISAN